MRSVLLLWCGVLLTCCSAELGVRPNRDAGRDTQVSDTGGDCSQMNAAVPAAQEVTSVQGRVSTLSGTNLQGTQVFLCTFRQDPGEGGRLTRLCLEPVDSSADGTFSVANIDASYRMMSGLIVRAIHPAQQQTGPVYSVAFDETAVNPVNGAINLANNVTMYPLMWPTTAPPRGTETMKRTLIFPGGIEMGLSPAMMDDPGQYEYLAAGSVDLSDVPPFAQNVAGLIALYATSLDASTTRCLDLASRSCSDSGYDLRLPNTTSLPNGTRVQLYLVGGLDTRISLTHSCGTTREYVREGCFQPVTTGTVMGNQIVADSPMPHLSWIGVSTQLSNSTACIDWDAI